MSPASTGCKVSVDATAPTHGTRKRRRFRQNSLLHNSEMLPYSFGHEGVVQLTSSDCVMMYIAGAVTPHAANAPQTDVAALKAAMEECTQQAQNLLVSCCTLFHEC